VDFAEAVVSGLASMYPASDLERKCTSACWVSDCLKFNLVVSMDCEPKSASRVRRFGESGAS
jgi:hypothetical protein